MFKCEKCGATAEQMQNCPTCNEPMVEVKEEQVTPEVGQPTEPMTEPTNEQPATPENAS